MDEQEAITFLKTQCLIEGATAEHLRTLWAKSRSAVDALPPLDLNAQVLELDEGVRQHLDAVSKQPMFTEVVQQRKWSFALVEIDKLVCFQKYIDTDYADELAEVLDITDTSGVVEFCLPLKPAKRQIAKTVDASQNVYTIFAPNMDLRILGMAEADDPVTKRKLFGFAVGFGVRFVQVVHLANRYFLKNGYHHVYALRNKGAKHVPCILLEGENFADSGAGRPGFFPDHLLLSAKPPTFVNFLADGAAMKVEMRPVTKFVRVKAEEFALPVITSVPPTEGTRADLSDMKTTKTGIEESDYEDFAVEKEDWNAYKLVDGTVVKLRQLLTRLRKEPGIEPSETGLQVELSNLLMATHPAPNLKGTPSDRQYSMEELVASIVENDMRYNTLRETANEYATRSNFRLTLRLASVKIAKTDKFDARGEPRYVANAQVQIQIVPPATTGGPG